jgi:8-oxo-dGTP diphosphatase
MKAPTKKYVICRDIWDKKYKVAAAELQFRPSVYGLVFRNDAILLSKQWDGYDFPGGGIEKGESIPDALRREVWEETGLTVKPGKLVNVFEDFFLTIEGKRPCHSILLYFLCTQPKGKITTKHFDEYEKEYGAPAEWMPVEKIKRLKFINSVDSPALIKEAYKLQRRRTK